MPTDSPQKDCYECAGDVASDAQVQVVLAPSERLVREKSARSEFVSVDAASAPFESVLDKFSRLKNEVEELRTELASAREAGAGQAGDCGEGLAKDLDTMKTALGAAANHPGLRPFMDHATTTALAPLPSADETAETVLSQARDLHAGHTGKGVTYDVYCAATGDSGMLEYDRRLAALTKVVGSSKGGPGPGGSASAESIRGRLADLHARLGCTEEYKLDAVYRRTKSLITEIDTVELPELSLRTASMDARILEEEACKRAKINELASSMRALDTTASSLPVVIGRLKTQKDLHETSRSLIGRLQRLEELNNTVRTVTSTDAAVAAKTSAQLASSLETMGKNMSLLQERMEALSKRM